MNHFSQILFIATLSLIIACGISPKSPLNQAHFTYSPQPFPSFLDSLFLNHQQRVEQLYGSSFDDFCQKHDVLSTDSLNRQTYFKLLFVHLLFTSEGASNGATGGTLNIPYLWHWVTPNPRHQIIHLSTGKPLSAIPPPNAFSRYQSFADIDRTPALFLTDLLKESPSYYHPQCDSFYTFGWCSEREMAFVQCMELLGYKGKVFSQGNHSWSCFWEIFSDQSGTKRRIELQVDNTFNALSSEAVTEKMTFESWQAAVGEGKLPKWYNRMAHDGKERTAIANLWVPAQVSHRIEAAVWAFF